MSGAEESYGEWYEKQMRKTFGDKRIHVMTERVPIRSIVDGAYVMYLPLEITEGADLLPEVAQVISKELNGEMWTIHTSRGKMFIRNGEAIQAVA